MQAHRHTPVLVRAAVLLEPNRPQCRSGRRVDGVEVCSTGRPAQFDLCDDDATFTTRFRFRARSLRVGPAPEADAHRSSVAAPMTRVVHQQVDALGSAASPC